MAIPIRKLICSATHLLHHSAEEELMPRTKRSRTGMSPVHSNAAAIDIGATVHMAAVGPDRDPEPVRSFGTFTGDLHRLADWSCPTLPARPACASSVPLWLASATR